MSLFAPSIGGYWAMLESHGLDPEALLREAGINPAVIFDSNARVPAKSLENLLDRVAALVHKPDFGLHEVQFFRPAHLGALGFSWLASSTLREAFHRLSRYARMINQDLQVKLTETPEALEIEFINKSASRHQTMREQRQLGLTVKFCRIVAGETFAPMAVEFRQATPREISSYFGFFRCELKFEGKRTALLVSNERADQRLTGSNEQIAQLNEHLVVKYLAHLEKEDIVHRTKATIIDNLSSGHISETMVAHALHTTPRNLHRKLAREQTSFKALLNDTRRELAQQYIRDHSLTLTEISFLLGFSEVSSFSRAFKNWTGVPPSTARANPQPTESPKTAD